jgi:hypothetical protein
MLNACGVMVNRAYIGKAGTPTLLENCPNIIGLLISRRLLSAGLPSDRPIFMKRWVVLL